MLFPMAMILAAATAAPTAQDAPAPQTARDAQSIVVTAEPRAPDETLRSFVRAVSAPGPAMEPLARFSGTLCVGAAGLPAPAGQAIVDRVAATAASLGLRIGAPGCTPNLIVLFVDDSRAAVRRLARGNSNALEGSSTADIRRIVDEPGDARAWIAAETLSRDGNRPTRYIDGPAFLTVEASTRLSSPVRRDIVRATVLIDREAVADMPLNRIADYVAMRGLTGARPRPGLGGMSILSLFTTDAGEAAPAALTDFDRGYLEGLYAGRGDRLPHVQRNAIARHIRVAASAPARGTSDAAD
jgi:hypothetical protein